MMQITDLKQEQQILPLFRLGFRPMFLFGTAFSVVAIIAWVLSLNGMLNFNPYGGSYWWHSHEMVFGFAGAIIVGFLLTAVQNWTGIPGVRGGKLIGLFMVWLLARVGLALPMSDASIIFVVLDIAFLPLGGLLLALPLVAVKQTRNMIFLPVLALFAIANALTHAAVYSGDMGYFQHGIGIAVFLVTLVMVIIGGRVMPMFTANGTNTAKVMPITVLEALSMGSVLALMLVHLFNLPAFIPAEVTGSLFVIAGLANFVRCLRWRIWVTLKTPLVWSLHIAYFSIAIGLVLMGISYFTPAVMAKAALHLLTVGGMGGLILAMVSRVSLGHTGRMLVVKPLMSLAFAAMFIAAIIRVFGVMLAPEMTSALLLSSGALWVVAFGLYLIYYIPVLTQARVDGRPG